MAVFVYAGDGGLFKSCSKCGEVKAAQDFNRNKKERSGFRNECRECQVAESTKYRTSNHEKELLRSKHYRLRNKEQNRQRLQRWRQKNREYVRQRDNAYNAKNRERVNEIARRYHRRKQADPQFRLENAMRACVYAGLTGCRKGWRNTFALLGYTVEELRAHLEAKFKPGMTWDNYGRYGWHVDHRRPLASFDYKTPECPSFKEAWALENLQPLWAQENISKGAKIIDA
jgi:hypothetical protein